MTAHEAHALAARLALEEYQHTLAGVCALVGIGQEDLRSRCRTADLVKHRAVVVWILADRLNWPLLRISQAVNRTPSQVRRLLHSIR